MRYQSRMHPTLDILCDSMGRVFLPESGSNKAHWTFGYLMPNGYRRVTIGGKGYLVARLICETFHGRASADRPTCDHIDRNRDRNVPENLRWADYKQQADNTRKVDAGLAKYGVRCCEDPNGYHRSLRAKNLEYAERQRAHYTENRDEILARRRERYAKNAEQINARQRGRYATDPEYAERRRAYTRERKAKQKALRLAAKEN